MTVLRRRMPCSKREEQSSAEELDRRASDTMAINAPPSACVRQSGERRAHSSVSEPHARSAHDPPMPLRPARESQPRIHRQCEAPLDEAQSGLGSDRNFKVGS
jgi:hypothetical protein